jgi:hypothetical protein
MKSLASKVFMSTAAAAAALAFAQPVWADPAVPATGSFFFISAPTTTVLHASEGNMLVRLDFPAAVLTGGISGRFSESLLIRTHPTGEQNVSGLAICACTVGGKSGTLFFDFVGRATAGGASEAHFVLSGEGGLADLHGTGTAAVSPAFVGTYDAEYHFAR